MTVSPPQLGRRQVEVLGLLRRNGTYPGGWAFVNHSITGEILDSLIKHGLVTKDSEGVYRPVDQEGPSTEDGPQRRDTP